MMDGCRIVHEMSVQHLIKVHVMPVCRKTWLQSLNQPFAEPVPFCPTATGSPELQSVMVTIEVGYDFGQCTVWGIESRTTANTIYGWHLFDVDRSIAVVHTRDSFPSPRNHSNGGSAYGRNFSSLP